jgi:ABC-type nitrate/sulfonate/bicarbonate transport system permease component
MRLTPLFLKRSCDIGLTLLAIVILVWWEVAARARPGYLGKPSDLLLLVYSENAKYWWGLAFESFWHALVAVVAATVISTMLLTVALFRDYVYHTIGKIVLCTQVIPMQIIGIVWYIAIFPITDITCLGCFTIFPAALVMIFPPFIYGANSIDHMRVEIKSAMLVWGASRYRRVRYVYLPHAIPYLLVGVKLIAAWAIPAILVFQSFVANSGALGPALARAVKNGEAAAFPLIFLTVLSGILMYTFFAWVQKKVEILMWGLAAVHKRQAQWH